MTFWSSCTQAASLRARISRAKVFAVSRELTVVVTLRMAPLFQKRQETSMETVTQGEFASATQREVDRLLAHYGESHQNPRNERIHFVAIPLIMLSLLGLLWAAHPWLAIGFVAAS